MLHKKRFFSSLAKSNILRVEALNKVTNYKSNFDPWFVTGLVDAEGSFVISVLKSSSTKTGWGVNARFKITAHITDLDLMLNLKKFFGDIGKIVIFKDTCTYQPSKINLSRTLGAKALQFSLINRKFSTGRLTKDQRNNFNLPQNIHEIIIGLSLGDLNIKRNYTNALLQFRQGLVNKEYIYHLFELFSSYSNMESPRHWDYLNKKTNKVYTSIHFYTYSLPCFNYYHELFYLDKVKRIPLNIGELLTPLGLAYWAMDDGVTLRPGFSLCTDSYTFSEVELLIKVLKNNFDLNCSIHKRENNQFRIYIKTESMNKFRSLVTPHFNESMMYKLSDK